MITYMLRPSCFCEIWALCESWITYIYIYIYIAHTHTHVIMKTMCPPSYHHNCFLETHALDLSTWYTVTHCWLVPINICINIYIYKHINIWQSMLHLHGTRNCYLGTYWYLVWHILVKNIQSSFLKAN